MPGKSLSVFCVEGGALRWKRATHPAPTFTQAWKRPQNALTALTSEDETDICVPQGLVGGVSQRLRRAQLDGMANGGGCRLSVGEERGDAGAARVGVAHSPQEAAGQADARADISKNGIIEREADVEGR